MIPDDWKQADIVPVHKKGLRSLAKNYRQISLTSIVVKLLETMMKPMILDHLIRNNIIHNRQSGFLPNKSCVSSLLEVIDHWTLSLELGVPLDVIYIDFEKAFDKVQHNILLDKLDAIGIRGTLLQWFESYLSNRKQRVKIGKSYSDWSDVSSGVPQGSVLGPLLFLIYTYDSPSNSNHSLYKLSLNTQLASFADDTKLYGECHSIDGYYSLNKALSDMVKWAQLNSMPLNINKCQTLHLGKTNAKLNYFIDSSVIEESNLIKDLGVWVDNQLIYSDHIAKISASANRLIGLFKVTFICITPEIFKIFYKLFIRPKLEYASHIWSPFLKREIDKLEKVQRRATKCVLCLSLLLYRERMRSLGLICLENRRKRADLILTWKILNGLISIDFSLPILLRSNERPNRGNALHLLPPCKRPPMTRIRNNFFTERVVATWNCLPNMIVTAPSISTFKGRLDNYWMDEKNLPKCSCCKPSRYCVVVN